MDASASNPRTVANLFVLTGSRKTPLAVLGQYYQTFLIDLVSP
jgi:hypothetical protein